MSSRSSRSLASWAASGEATRESEAANAASERNTRASAVSDELVLLLAARRAVLAAPLDEHGVVAPGAGDCGNEGRLLLFGESLPSGGPEPLERTVADLVLHAGRPLDPVAEVDVGKLRCSGAPDVIEDDVVPKPRTRLMLWVIEAVDHRQPIPLPVGEAGADETPWLSVRSRFPVFKHKTRHGGVCHHVRVRDLVHCGDAAARVPLAQVALEKFELFRRRPRPALGHHEVAVAPHVAPLLCRWLKLVRHHAHRYAG